MKKIIIVLLIGSRIFAADNGELAMRPAQFWDNRIEIDLADSMAADRIVNFGDIKSKNNKAVRDVAKEAQIQQVTLSDETVLILFTYVGPLDIPHTAGSKEYEIYIPASFVAQAENGKEFGLGKKRVRWDIKYRFIKQKTQLQYVPQRIQEVLAEAAQLKQQEAKKRKQLAKQELESKKEAEKKQEAEELLQMNLGS